MPPTIFNKEIKLTQNLIQNNFKVYTILYSKQVVKNVFNEEETKWKQLLYSTPEMSVYRNIHCKLKPIHLWAVVKENPGLRKYFNRFIALLSMKTVPKLSTYCKRMQNNFNVHIMLNCSLFVNERDKLLEDLLDFFFLNMFLLICKIPKSNIWLYQGALQIPVLPKLHLKSEKKL